MRKHYTSSWVRLGWSVLVCLFFVPSYGSTNSLQSSFLRQKIQALQKAIQSTVETNLPASGTFEMVNTCGDFGCQNVPQEGVVITGFDDCTILNLGQRGGECCNDANCVLISITLPPGTCELVIDELGSCGQGGFPGSARLYYPDCNNDVTPGGSNSLFIDNPPSSICVLYCKPGADQTLLLARASGFDATCTPQIFDASCVADVPEPEDAPVFGQLTPADYPVVFGPITVNSACGNLSGHVDVSQTGGGCPDNPMTVTHTYRIVDVAADAALIECTYEWTVINQTGPDIQNPTTSIELSCGDPLDPIRATSPVATDVCIGNDVTLDFDDELIIDNCEVLPGVTGTFPDKVFQAYLRTWTATDACGNTSTTTQMVYLFDNEPPMVECPRSVTIDCSDPLPDPIDPIITDACGGPTSVVDYTEDGPQFIFACREKRGCPRRWIVSDACGNTNSCLQLIDLEDRQAPVIVNCPPEITIQCGDDTNPANTGILGDGDWTDNCDTNPTIGFTDTPTGNNCAYNSVIARNWTVTDGCNQTACTQFIHITPILPAFIDPPGDITITCNDVIPPLEELCYSNNADGDCLIEDCVDGEEASSGNPFCESTQILRTWLIRICDQEIVHRQFITVVAEPLSIDCPAGGTVECVSELPDPATVQEMVEAGLTGGCNFQVSFIGYRYEFPDVCLQGTPAIVAQRTICECTGAKYQYVFHISSVCSNNPPEECIVEYVIDRPAPTIQCPADETVACFEDIRRGVPDITASCEGDYKYETELQVVYGPGCTNPIPVSPIQLGDNAFAPCNCPGTQYFLTFIVTDDCGREASCTQTFTIANDPPELICPDDVTVECSIDAYMPLEELPFTTSCELGFTLNDAPLIELTSGTPGCPGASYTVTYSGLDDCGREASCIQMVTVVPGPMAIPTIAGNCTLGASDDNLLFVICCEADEPVVECKDDIVPTPPGVITNCQLGYTMETSDPELVEGQENCGGAVYAVTFTVTDDCGRTASCSQTFTIENAPPAFTFCPDELTLECGDPRNEAIIAAWLASATGTASCDLGYTITNTYSPDKFSDGCGMTGNQTVGFIIEDACGRKGFCRSILYIEDTRPPVITKKAVTVGFDCNVSDIEAEFASWAAAQGGAEAWDACGEVTWTYEGSPSYLCSETPHFVVFTATDECGNTSTTRAFFNVVDHTAPQVWAPEDKTIDCGGAYDFDRPTIRDCSEYTYSYKDFYIGDGDCPGEETKVRRWTVTDACGNSSTAEQRIHRRDETAPTLRFVHPLLRNLKDGDELVVDCDNMPIFGLNAVEAYDKCDGDCFIDIYMSDPGRYSSTGCAANYPNLNRMYCKWVAMDDCGNMSSISVNITIRDTKKPVIAPIPASITFNCGEAPAFSRINTSDCGKVTVQVFDRTEGEACTAGHRITRTWIATDECGNWSSVSQVATLNAGSAALAITGLPDEETVGQTAAFRFATPEVISTCAGGYDLNYEDAVQQESCSQVVIRTWTARDGCGNHTSASQRIRVKDMEGPEITGIPADQLVSSVADISPAVKPQVNDASAYQMVFKEEWTNTGNAGDLLTRTWTATDACGNVSVAKQRIRVLGLVNTTVAFIYVPANQTLQCDEILAIDAPTAGTTCNKPEALSLTFRDEEKAGACGGRIIHRIWTAMDACGGVAVTRQIIEVKGDKTAPVFTSLPVNEVRYCGEPMNFREPVAEDECGIAKLKYKDETVGVPDCVNGQSYFVYRTWTATDGCGNAATAQTAVWIWPSAADNSLADNTDAVSFREAPGEIPDNVQQAGNLKLYPNPVHSLPAVNLELVSLDNGEAVINLFDAFGKQIKRIEVGVNAGMNLLNLDISTLPRGAFVVRVEAPMGETHTVKLIKN